MQCKDAQELILTDYLDGDMNEEQKKGLKVHMADCPKCCEFAVHAESTVIAPFEDAPVQQPSPQVWQNIKESIEEQQRATNPVADFFEKLKGIVFAPRPAFAFATVLVIALLTVKLFLPTDQSNQIVQVDVNGEEIEYVVYVMSDIDDSGDESDGYGTDIEEYFL